MERITIKVDLHIHTPASKCYRGTDTDDEYLEILRCAKKRQLDVIAITDHNSIAGYKRIQDIKSKLISERAKNPSVNPSLDEKLDLFKKIVILPGVEFEVSNCVHFTVIFNDATSLNDIDKFLDAGGYDVTQRGLEDPVRLSRWSILDLYEETKAYDCFVLDSHTDSNKGVFNTIIASQLRAEAFKSDQLYGVGYKSEKQKQNIVQILKTGREYSRTRPLAFLKLSDAHSAADVGGRVTWFRVENASYAGIKDAFTNPEENIFTERPDIGVVLNKLVKLENSFGVENLSGGNRQYLKKLICAINNSGGGYCLIGVSREKAKIGLPYQNLKKDLLKYFNSLFGVFKQLDAKAETKEGFNFYQIQGEKIVISVHIAAGKKLIGMNGDGRVYLLKGREIILSSVPEVQEMVERMHTVVIEEKIQKRLAKIEKESLLIKDYFSAMPIISKYEKDSVSLFSKITRLPLKKSEQFSEREVGKIEDTIQLKRNGYSEGDILFYNEITKPRLETAYLRATVPLLRLNKKQPDKKETLYLLPGGCVFISSAEVRFYSNHGLFCLPFRSASREYSNKLILAFLKSSFWLWYCLNKYETLDVSNTNIVSAIRIPKINFLNPQLRKYVADIEDAVGRIVEMEKDFLDKFNSSGKEADSSKLIETHNNAVCHKFHGIDVIVYKLLSISDMEIKKIEDFLRRNDVFLFSPQGNLVGGCSGEMHVNRGGGRGR